MRRIRKLLVANRSEIAIRVMRAAAELGIRTVAIYANEDRYALHRFKADEAYLVGVEGRPLQSYLNIDEIVALAKEHEIDAIPVVRPERDAVRGRAVDAMPAHAVEGRVLEAQRA